METENYQTVLITDRQKLEITKVSTVVSFSDDYLELSTSAGEMYIEGSELRIEELSQEKEKILITGKINGLFYKNTDKHLKKNRKK